MFMNPPGLRLDGFQRVVHAVERIGLRLDR